MKIWSYIGEFFLFRWLFGKLNSLGSNHGRISQSQELLNDTGSRDTGNDLTSSNLSETSHRLGVNESYSVDNKDYLDGSEDLDDLDLFMLKNSSTNPNFKSGSGSSSMNDFIDYNEYLDDHSFDDFTEEQDDYDMFDDF